MRAPSRITRRKIRILQSELQMLQHYNSEITLLLEDYRSEYSRDMSFFRESFPSSSLEEPPVPDDESAETISFDPEKKEQTFRKTVDGFEEVEEDADTRPSQSQAHSPGWAKKLFKKIALMTHPDRVNDELMKEKLRQVFLRASKAVDEGDMDDLVGVALELNLDAGIDDEQLIPMLEGKIKKTKEEINQTETSIEWVWGEAYGLSEIRVNILLSIMKKEGFLLSKADAVAIILERENSNNGTR